MIGNFEHNQRIDVVLIVNFEHQITSWNYSHIFVDWISQKWSSKKRLLDKNFLENYWESTKKNKQQSSQSFHKEYVDLDSNHWIAKKKKKKTSFKVLSDGRGFKLTLTCSKSAIETLEKDVKYVQS